MGKFNLSSELFAIILFRKIQLIVGIGMAWKLRRRDEMNGNFPENSSIEIILPFMSGKFPQKCYSGGSTDRGKPNHPFRLKYFHLNISQNKTNNVNVENYINGKILSN